MTQVKDLADIVGAAEHLIRTLPAHLQRPGWLVQVGEGTQTGKPPPPCITKDCRPPPCTGTDCFKTIIGHDPLLSVAAALVIGVVIGLVISSWRNQSRGR